jgi:GntR family transcriptional repressor for pyruvate dehydrogenase complex
MPQTREPVVGKKLPLEVAERIQRRIHSGSMTVGDRLPSIASLAREYGVGAPTVREALKRLEIAGVVSIRHGSGVFVRPHADAMLVTSPMYAPVFSKKTLLDLIEARAAIEVTAAGLAAGNATAAQLDELQHLLAEAESHLADADVLNRVNMSFHRAIAEASGNSVFRQLLEVLTNVFAREQRMILDIQDARAEDHQQHVAVYEALRARQPELAREQMAEHLAKVRRDLERWDDGATA